MLGVENHPWGIFRGGKQKQMSVRVSLGVNPTKSHGKGPTTPAPPDIGAAGSHHQGKQHQGVPSKPLAGGESSLQPLMIINTLIML